MTRAFFSSRDLAISFAPRGVATLRGPTAGGYCPTRTGGPAGVDTVRSGSLFYAAVLALSPNVLPFEPFDQAFPADSRARQKQLLTVDRCRTGERTRAGARMACELTRNRLYWYEPRPIKETKLAWRGSANKS